jgi:Putative abortive phage resistance protein AbiGi, antitoxin
MEVLYTSTELFHFVGRRDPSDDRANYENLLKILAASCVSHPPHDNNWGQVSYTINWDRSLEKEELIVPTVTCYADIPFDSLSVHVAKYGKFGLSFPRDLLIPYGARPVMYIPTRNDDWRSIHGTTLIRDLEAVYKGFYTYVKSKSSSFDTTTSRGLGAKPSNEADAADAILSVFAKDFLAFVKPFNSHLGQNHPANYYMEREWRKHGNLKFDPSDVAKIVVAKAYLSRLEREYPEYLGKVIGI